MTGKYYLLVISVVVSLLTIMYQTILFIICLIIWLLYLFYKRRISQFVLGLSLLSAFFFYFHFLDTEKVAEVNLFNEKQDVDLSGKITSSIKISEVKIEFTLKEATTKAKYQIIYFPKDELDTKNQVLSTIRSGATCTIRGEVNYPNEPTNEGQFDFKKYYLNQGIVAQIFIEQLTDLSCTGANTLEFIYAFRLSAISFMQEKLGDFTAPWINALVLGDDSLIADEIIDLFQRWGLSHILAISGLHVGLLVGIFYFLFIRLNILTREKTEWLLLFLLPIYAVIAGGEPSVWRASLMFFLLLVLRKFKFNLNILDSLSIIFLLLVIFNKYIIFQVGFQFSFFVTFGLILSSVWLRVSSSSVYRLLQISFVSQMVILPLQLHYFHYFQPASILLNIVIVPYFSVFVIPYLLFLLFISLAPINLVEWFEKVFITLHQFVMDGLFWLDHWLNFPFVIGSFSIGFVIVYYVLFFMFMAKLEQNNRIYSYILGMMLALVIMYGAVKPYLNPYGEITMLDIGQGDAIILELPYRKGVFFIDAGATFNFNTMEASPSVYRSIIKPYLLAKGIQKIDGIFISHPDLDHDGSVDYLVEDLRVDEIFISEYHSLSLEKIREYNGRGTKITRLLMSEMIHKNGQLFRVLSPQKDKQDANENSLVIEANIGGINWIFLGDIGKKTEEEILLNSPNLLIDVVKVAHHGSNTSTSQKFLESINPNYALISVGRANRYGHPTDEVLETLLEQNLELFRTDQNGAIKYIFTDQSGRFETFLKE